MGWHKNGIPNQSQGFRRAIIIYVDPSRQLSLHDWTFGIGIYIKRYQLLLHIIYVYI